MFKSSYISSNLSLRTTKTVSQVRCNSAIPRLAASIFSVPLSKTKAKTESARLIIGHNDNNFFIEIIGQGVLDGTPSFDLVLVDLDYIKELESIKEKDVSRDRSRDE